MVAQVAALFADQFIVQAAVGNKVSTVVRTESLLLLRLRLNKVQVCLMCLIVLVWRHQIILNMRVVLA